MSQHFRQIEQLRGWRQTAFLTALAERAYINFALFAELTGQGSIKPLRRALNTLWESLPNQDLIPNYIKLAELVEDELPNPAQLEGYGVYPAADACTLVLDALESRLKADKKQAMPSAQRSLATVTSFVEMNDSEGVDEDDLVRHLDRHPLVKLELGFQRELVERLRRASYPSQEFVDELRALAENDGVSNIGIALDDDEDEDNE